jgi:acetaldehyde dehydrogenase (acetylating)
VLLGEIERVGKDEPLSMEKLSPILAFYTVDGWLEGCHKCIDLLNFGGMGHTMSIHSNDNDIIMKFALEKPAFRIIVNSPSSLGAVGFTTALYPSLTLGVGTIAGSIISENVTAKHLMNVKTLAYEVNPVNKAEGVSSYTSTGSSSGSFMQQIEERLLARAGNPAVPHSFEKSAKTQTAGEKKSSAPFGSGITKEEIDKIIKDFNR